MLIWKHIDGSTSEQQPTRIRLPDRTTRSHEAITPELLAEAGWSQVEVEDPIVANVFITGENIGTGP